MCVRDYGPQKETPEFLNRSSLVGTEDPASRKNLGTPGLDDIGARPHKEKINKILKFYKLTNWPADDLRPIE